MKNNANLGHRIVTRSYTWLKMKRFRNWGKGSRLYWPANLNLPQLIHVGNNVIIREHAWLNAKDDRTDGRPTLVIESGTYVGRFVHINAWRDVVIESQVLIADRVYISDADHCFVDPKVPIKLQGDEFKGRVLLCSGCWIGIGAVILPGVRVGLNAVVAANSVVNRDVPDYTIVGGIPAKFIKRIGK